MDEKNDLIKVFSGSLITVNLLKTELEKEGIETTVHNEYQEAMTAGYATGTPYSVDLFIIDSDLEKAQPIINQFKTINEE